MAWEPNRFFAVHTVAICDPEPIAIEGLRRLVGWDRELSVVATESSLADALDVVQEMRPEVLLVQCGLGRSAIAECVAALRASGCPTAVVVWRACLSWPESLRLLQAGVAGVVRRNASLKALLACLRAVASGGVWADGEIRSDERRLARGRSAPLTPREAQIFRLTERGLRYSEIAQMLGIRPGTVKVHLKHIAEKTGARSRYGMA
jgi:DNA-binding NarL/FixJ family response regulator